MKDEETIRIISRHIERVEKLCSFYIDLIKAKDDSAQDIMVDIVKDFMIYCDKRNIPFEVFVMNVARKLYTEKKQHIVKE